MKRNHVNAVGEKLARLKLAACLTLESTPDELVTAISNLSKGGKLLSPFYLLL